MQTDLLFEDTTVDVPGGMGRATRRATRAFWLRSVRPPDGLSPAEQWAWRIGAHDAEKGYVAVALYAEAGRSAAYLAGYRAMRLALASAGAVPRGETTPVRGVGGLDSRGACR